MTSAGLQPSLQPIVSQVQPRDRIADSRKTNPSNGKEDERSGSADKNIWIVKPGENTNRGVGIDVCSKLREIKKIISQSDFDQSRTFIL